MPWIFVIFDVSLSHLRAWFFPDYCGEFLVSLVERCDRYQAEGTTNEREKHKTTSQSDSNNSTHLCYVK